MLGLAAKVVVVLTLALTGLFLPAEAMASAAQHVGAGAHYLDEALLGMAAIGGIWVLDGVFWPLLTSDR